jgi:hypothetical protein
MVIRRIGPLSVAKVAGLLYAVMGLLFGGLISLFSIVGARMIPSEETGGIPGLLFGAAAIIVLPIFYGVLGFVMSLIAAALYNVAASAIGGVEVDIQ